MLWTLSIFVQRLGTHQKYWLCGTTGRANVDFKIRRPFKSFNWNSIINTSEKDRRTPKTTILSLSPIALCVTLVGCQFARSLSECTQFSNSLQMTHLQYSFIYSCNHLRYVFPGVINSSAQHTWRVHPFDSPQVGLCHFETANGHHSKVLVIAVSLMHLVLIWWFKNHCFLFQMNDWRPVKQPCIHFWLLNSRFVICCLNRIVKAKVCCK